MRLVWNSVVIASCGHHPSILASLGGTPFALMASDSHKMQSSYDVVPFRGHNRGALPRGRRGMKGVSLPPTLHRALVTATRRPTPHGRTNSTYKREGSDESFATAID